jgi:hypothetical protein
VPALASVHVQEFDSSSSCAGTPSNAVNLTADACLAVDEGGQTSSYFASCTPGGQASLRYWGNSGACSGTADYTGSRNSTGPGATSCFAMYPTYAGATTPTTPSSYATVTCEPDVCSFSHGCSFNGGTDDPSKPCSLISVPGGTTTEMVNHQPCPTGKYAALISTSFASAGAGSEYPFQLRAYIPPGPVGSPPLYRSDTGLTCFTSPWIEALGVANTSQIAVSVACALPLGQNCLLWGKLDVACYTNGQPAVPINGGWSSWGACNSTCAQTRSCTSPSPDNGGMECTGESYQACAESPCPSRAVNAAAASLTDSHGALSFILALFVTVVVLQHACRQ